MKTSIKIASVGVILLAISSAFIGNHYYQDNMKHCNASYDEKDALVAMTLKNIAFMASKNEMALIKSKNCAETQSFLEIRPSVDILKSAESFVKVYIDGEEYNVCKRTTWTYDKYVPRNIFWRDQAISRVGYNLTLPSYQEFKKDELAIKCEFYSDGQLIESIEDKIQFLDDGEEMTSYQNRISSRSGPCLKPGYFENEVLYSLNKKGTYYLDKEMVTTVTLEENRFKLVSHSPQGYLVNYEDNSRIPVPAFPENVSYAELSSNLESGTYHRHVETISNNAYLVNEKSQGKYLAYYYDVAEISNEKTVSYKDCELIVHQTNCNRIPSGIYLSFEDYPADINNTYASLGN